MSEDKSGRSEKNASKRSEKRAIRDEKAKSFLIVITVMIFVFGLLIVDKNYSEMMDKEGKIIPKVRRTDEENVVISVFGKGIQVNTKDFEIQIAQNSSEDNETAP